jgi:hypothetical protein
MRAQSVGHHYVSREAHATLLASAKLPNPSPVPRAGVAALSEIAAAPASKSGSL